MTGTKNQYKLGVFGGQTWVMPTGKSYAGYGDECTPENIYHVLRDYLQRKIWRIRAAILMMKN